MGTDFLFYIELTCRVITIESNTKMAAHVYKLQYPVFPAFI